MSRQLALSSAFSILAMASLVVFAQGERGHAGHDHEAGAEAFAAAPAQARQLLPVIVSQFSR